MADDGFRPFEMESPTDDGFRPFNEGPGADLTKQAAPTESGESIVTRALKMGRGMTLPIAGSIAGTALGTATPIPGGAMIGESLGAGSGEALSQFFGWSEPSKTAIGAAMLAGPGGRMLKPVWQGAKEMGIKLFAGRDVVSEAAESLLKKWLSPAVSSQALYQAAEGTKAVIPYGETARTVQDIVTKEIGRMPLPARKELLETLSPIMSYTAPTQQTGRKGFQMVSSAPVADVMSDVSRLRLEATRAFKAGNSDVGQAINRVRAAVLNDLEAAGVPEVKMAAQAYRKEMALENLSREIARPTPGTKIRDYARKDPLFKGAFTPDEMAQIDRVAKKLTYVVPSGSSGLIGRMATTVAGGETGGLSGGIAGLLGPELIRNLIATPYGRGVTERVLAGTFAPGPKEAAILASIARALGGQMLQGGEQE